jgi:sugar phosphate isomerase/epimerase
LRQALVTAAHLGADGVEIDARTELPPVQLSRTGLREVHRLLDDLNLRVSAVAFPTRRGYEVADDLERRVEATQTAMRMAHDLRSDVLVNRVGRVPENEHEPAYARMIEALTAIGVYAERVGVRLAAQTADESPQKLAGLIDALPEHSVGIDFYPAGLVQAGYSTVEAVEILGRHVIHVHACDAVRDMATRRAIQVELGRGSADLPEILGRLTQFEYRGWVTIEQREAADPINEIGNAVAYLRSL